MDTPAQDNQQVNPTTTSGSTSVVNQTTQVQDGAQQPQPTQSPQTVTPGKETAPIAITKPEEQWVGETAPEASVTEELEKAGVEATPGEVLEVPPDVAQVGVASTGTATAIPTNPTVKFPLTEEKAKGILKMHKKVRDSVTWLAMLVVRQFQMMQKKEKKR